MWDTGGTLEILRSSFRDAQELRHPQARKNNHIGRIVKLSNEDK